MNSISASLEKWRDYFGTADADIFSIIEHAIMVAASDCPYDFKGKRDRIAELLFTCKVTKCLGCNRAELCVGNGDCLKEIDGDGEFIKDGEEGGGSKDSKESKVISSSGDEAGDGDEDEAEGGDGDGDEVEGEGGDGQGDGDEGRDVDDDHKYDVETNVENGARDREYDDAEALTDEMEEEAQFLEEVVRIKGVLEEREEKSEEVLFESLRRLQLMPLSVDILKATEIGRTVNVLRKHGSREIRNLVKQLVEGWKLMVRAWVEATYAIADLSPESAKTSGVDNEDDEEGLPSPPLDEGAFFANPGTVEWSQFFDGMDDDGNLQDCGEFDTNQRNGGTRVPERTDIPPLKLGSPSNSRTPPKESKAEIRRNRESTMKKQSPPCKPNTPVRPKPRPNLPMQRNTHNVVKARENIPIQRKPPSQQQEKSSRNNEASSHQMKLEDAKRKLHERYQEAEKAKKQRTIQVVELRDLPKQSLARGNQHMRRRW